MRCAQITPLTGGKRDELPPKALSFNPENTSLNFTAKEIEITFNEYVVLKDLSNQLIITPQLKETPDIQATGKKIKIKFNETLLPNTTYKIGFGNSITDLNESNIAQNFEYVFSTGPTIDSLKLNGNVINAINLKTESQILIGLYDANSNDSIVYKNKPLYITKTNESGHFSFNYLPNNNFKVFGIKDNNKNLLYDGSDEQIAFLNNTINPIDTSSINLLLFKEVPSKSFIKKSISNEYGKAIVVFNKPHNNVSRVSSECLVHYYFNKTHDTLSLYYKGCIDTLKTIINYTDKKADSLFIKILNEKAFKKAEPYLKYTISSTNTQSNLPFFQKPTLEFNFPLEKQSVNLNKILLIEKSDSITKPIPYTISIDSVLKTKLTINALLKSEQSYTLTLLKGAIDMYNRQNDSIVYKFNTTSPDDYSTLTYKLLFPKKENYIVRLMNEREQIVNEQTVSFSLTTTSEKIFTYNNLTPGSYFISIVEDANKNGLFDTGTLLNKQQPEIIYINPSSIKLLAGWEIENEWQVK